MIEKYTFSQLARRYCDKCEQTPEGLLKILQGQGGHWKCDGWFLAECQDLSSSYMGHLVILPYGPNNTFKTLPSPSQCFSPRGLASDQSIAVAYIEVADLPAELPDDLKDWTTPPPPKKRRKIK